LLYDCGDLLTDPGTFDFCLSGNDIRCDRKAGLQALPGLGRFELDGKGVEHGKIIGEDQDLDDEKERACSYVHDLDLVRELREETGERFDRHRAGRSMP
jgi:hypothetical protein